MTGSNITSNADKLQKVDEGYLFHGLVHPKPAIEARIRQLRTIYTLDHKQYAAQKRALPYVTCGIFAPPFRKNENFAYIENFILDIDHLSHKGLQLEVLRDRLRNDRRVLMSFASPSKDGLKVMFRLSERCYDAGLYKIFYRAFATHFAAEYHLEQVVDGVTCDASRACFISHDPDTYYNPGCEQVVLASLANEENPMMMFDLMKRQEKEQRKEESAKNNDNAAPADPDARIMAQIKQQLNIAQRATKQKNEAFVPEILNDITESLCNYISGMGITVACVDNIQYGKKLRCLLGLRRSEVNVFYGKRGFSVVISPASGTSAELNELTAMAIKSFLSTIT